MSLFDDAVATGLDAAEAAWGTSWAIVGSSDVFTGSFDRHRDSKEPALGGYMPEVDATLVASLAQFAGSPILAQDDSEMQDESFASIEDETGKPLPTIGQRLNVAGQQYLITGIENDGHAITLELKSPNR